MSIMIGLALVGAISLFLGAISLWLGWRIERLDKRMLDNEDRLASLRDDLEKGLIATFEEEVGTRQ